jgi:hypothetical protein
MEKTNEDPQTLTVSAEAHSDDHHVEIDFDATPWFVQASDKKIQELIQIDFGGDLASDSVAEFFEETTTKRLFEYLSFKPTMGSDERVGFECHVDEQEAMAWLRANRPHLISNIYRFTVTGGLDVQGVLTPVRAYNGDVVGFKTSDGRTIRLVIGFEVESPEGENYTYVAGDDAAAAALGLENIEYDQVTFDPQDA